MELAFLSKKNWIPGSLKNIQQIWKAEQSRNEEEKPDIEIAKKLKEEQEIEEPVICQAGTGLLPNSVLDRVALLFAPPTSQEHQPETQIADLKLSPLHSASVHRCTCPQIESASEVKERLLFLIRQKEFEIEQEVEELYDKVKKKEEKRRKKEEKKRRKEEKKKAKKEKKKLRKERRYSRSRSRSKSRDKEEGNDKKEKIEKRRRRKTRTSRSRSSSRDRSKSFSARQAITHVHKVPDKYNQGSNGQKSDEIYNLQKSLETLKFMNVERATDDDFSGKNGIERDGAGNKFEYLNTKFGNLGI